MADDERSPLSVMFSASISIRLVIPELKAGLWLMAGSVRSPKPVRYKVSPVAACVAASLWICVKLAGARLESVALLTELARVT